MGFGVRSIATIGCCALAIPSYRPRPPKGVSFADALGNMAESDWPQVRLGIIKTLAPPILEQVVKTLSAECTLEILEGMDSELRSAMSGGRIDLAVGLVRRDEQGGTIFPLFDEPYVMLATERPRDCRGIRRQSRRWGAQN